MFEKALPQILKRTAMHADTDGPVAVVDIGAGEWGGAPTKTWEFPSWTAIGDVIDGREIDAGVEKSDSSDAVTLLRAFRRWRAPVRADCFEIQQHSAGLLARRLADLFGDRPDRSYFVHSVAWDAFEGLRTLLSTQRVPPLLSFEYAYGWTNLPHLAHIPAQRFGLLNFTVPQAEALSTARDFMELLFVGFGAAN
eukprot:gene6369-23051_t